MHNYIVHICRSTVACVRPKNSLQRPHEDGWRVAKTAWRPRIQLDLAFEGKLLYFPDSSWEPFCKNAGDRSVAVINLDPWKFCNNLPKELWLYLSMAICLHDASKQVCVILPLLRIKVRGLRWLEFGTSIILSSNMSDLCMHCASQGKWYRGTVSNHRFSRSKFTLTLKNITSAWLICRMFRILYEHISPLFFQQSNNWLLWLSRIYQILE